MQTKLHPSKGFMTLPGAFLLVFVLFFLGCKKEDPLENLNAQQYATAKRGKPTPPPPPPPAFYFTDCYNPNYAANFAVGVPANISITKNYVNSPGGSYPAFTSTTVNGITWTAPAGTFNVGSGAVTFTATGTPVATGFFNQWIGVGNIQQCMLILTAGNAPVSGPNADPGPTAGSTGIVNFTYRGQAVAYKTVRARDGKIWLQQNLGSPQVAFHTNDETSYGDYFQWGRWDDGHQVANSTAVTGGPAFLNPSSIPSGNPNFVVGQTAGTRWWGTGGIASDTWNSTTASSTSGKDPCAALGPGWRLPTAADWQNLKNHEDLEGSMTAFTSNLKLPAAGYRDAYGGFVFRGGETHYWSGTALNNSYATMLFISDNTYAATLQASERGQGYSCRCVKD